MILKFINNLLKCCPISTNKKTNRRFKKLIRRLESITIRLNNIFKQFYLTLKDQDFGIIDREKRLLSGMKRQDFIPPS